MSSLKKATLWMWMLTKRLYKKPTFLAILVLIPLLTMGYRAIVKGESGVATVALYGESDPVTQEVFQQMEGSGQLLRYIRCESPERAELLVRTGKADAAWIFPEDLQASLKTFAEDFEAGKAFVRVVQREENVLLALIREKLSGALYPYIAEEFYIQYMREKYPKLDHLTDEELMEYYEGSKVSGELFDVESDVKEQVQQVHYLMSPLRGLLAVVVVLGGMAAAMYHIRDEENGTFHWLSLRKRILPELAGQLVTSLNLGLVALLALWAVGMAQSLPKELLAWVLYSLCTALFCMVLRRLLGSIRVLGTAIPLLVVGMLLICPVFFDLGPMRQLQRIFPPTYYINCVYESRYILLLLAYCTACGAICLLLDRLQSIRVRRWWS